MAVTAHRAINHVDATTASQSSKRDAAGVRVKEVLTFWQEWQELQQEKSDVDYQLGLFNTRMAKEQLAIRKNGSNQKTIAQWITRKEELQNERQMLVDRKKQIELRMTNIRHLAMQGKAEVHREQVGDTETKDGKHTAIFVGILQELKAIRELLESKVS